MSTTPEALEAMARADWLRAKRASSSMHPSWLDAGALAALTKDLREQNSKTPPPDWWTAWAKREAASYEAELAATANSTTTPETSAD